MANPEIVRELVDGDWVTTVGSSGGAGGPVTAGDIDSEAAGNGEVLTADGAGGASWQAGGGSQAFSQVRFPFAYNTPGIAADGMGGGGVTIYTPAAGEFIFGAISITTAFEGTPYCEVAVISAGDDPENEYLTQTIGSNVDDPLGSPGSAHLTTIANPPFAAQAAVLAMDANPIKVVLTDGSGGNPSASAGVGEIILLIVAAP